jgi:hypothetical protein
MSCGRGASSLDAELRWPSGNTLAFNAENPGSTPDLGDRYGINFSSRSTADRISGFQFELKVTFRNAVSTIQYNC